MTKKVKVLHWEGETCANDEYGYCNHLYTKFYKADLYFCQHPETPNGEDDMTTWIDDPFKKRCPNCPLPDKEPL